MESGPSPRRTPGALFLGLPASPTSVNENSAGESVVESAGAVEKPKNGFPTAPWTFGPHFPQRRLLLDLPQTQLFFYSRELSPNLDRLTVGVDLGDQWSHYCILDLQGETLSEGRLRTSEAEVAEFFQPLPSARW